MFRYLKNSRKVLGMNSRNLEYIRPCNLSEAKHLADDKLFSKKILKKNGVAVPRLIAKIKSHEDLETFDWSALPDSFALKPNRGFGGEGIIVVYGKKKPARPPASMSEAFRAGNTFGIADIGENEEDAWIKADRSIITVKDLRNHIRNILDGSFSLSNTPDIAFFEERLKLLKLFKPYAFKGIPDIRVIVYNKVPIMAMLRLPTKDSGGKANLQQGAIGVGIDLATGVTTTAVQGKNKIIDYVPGTRILLSGLRIPYWKDILELAVHTQEISKLGYLGVDVAIDKEQGPVILELNARPGLSIQIANLAGLKERLERVSEIKIKTIKKGVRVGMDLFGGEIEEELEEISGRKIIGTVEKVKLVGKNEIEVEVEAKIDTGAGYSSIDTELARQLGFEKTIEAYEKAGMMHEDIKLLSPQERIALFKDVPDLADTAIIHSSHGTSYRPMINIKIIMDSIEIPARVSIIDRSQLKMPIIVGKKNLGKFLIDVNK